MQKKLVLHLDTLRVLMSDDTSHVRGGMLGDPGTQTGDCGDTYTGIPRTTSCAVTTQWKNCTRG